ISRSRSWAGPTLNSPHASPKSSCSSIPASTPPLWKPGPAKRATIWGSPSPFAPPHASSSTISTAPSRGTSSFLTSSKVRSSRMQIRWLASRPSDYLPVWQAMRDFTAARLADTPDEIWLTEHQPVYTLGQAGKREHLLNPGTIPVVDTDRGGQVTYHGPGQVVAYVLFDLRRAGYYIKEYVHRVEQSVIDVLDEFGIPGACREPGAPGVYVPLAGAAHNAKIAALGIKVSRGCTYHGVALNVDMDLAPYLGINPCGYAGLRTVDMRTCGVRRDLETVGNRLAASLAGNLNRLAS